MKQIYDLMQVIKGIMKVFMFSRCVYVVTIKYVDFDAYFNKDAVSTLKQEKSFESEKEAEEYAKDTVHVLKQQGMGCVRYEISIE